MTFYTDQKGRLKDKGVVHMHLKKDSAPQVKKYRAQNFLNEKILEFQKKKKWLWSAFFPSFLGKQKPRLILGVDGDSFCIGFSIGFCTIS